MARPSVDLAQVEIRPISKDDEIAEFSCGDDADDQDLNDYFRTDALRSRDLGLAHIYVAVVSGKIVGYAALLTDIVRLKTRDITSLGMDYEDPPGVPALKVGRLAICAQFKKDNRGLGTAMMGFCYSIAAVVAAKVGCRLITVDALPKSVGFYEKLGFLKNKLKPEKGEEASTTLSGCTSMRFDINADPLPNWCLGV